MRIDSHEFLSECDAQMGYCSECDAVTTACVEPDAAGYDCDDCGKASVMGLEDAVMSGHVEVSA